MKFKDLKILSPTELNQKKQELYTELIKQNAQRAVGTNPKNPGKLKQTKKTLAKIHHILAEAERKA